MLAIRYVVANSRGSGRPDADLAGRDRPCAPAHRHVGRRTAVVRGTVTATSVSAPCLPRLSRGSQRRMLHDPTRAACDALYLVP